MFSLSRHRWIFINIIHIIQQTKEIQTELFWYFISISDDIHVEFYFPQEEIKDHILGTTM